MLLARLQKWSRSPRGGGAERDEDPERPVGFNSRIIRGSLEVKPNDLAKKRKKEREKNKGYNMNNSNE